MPIESEKIKVLVEFKKKLEERISEIESELQEKKVTLEALNSILIEKGFKRGDIKSVVSSKQSKIPSKISISVIKQKPSIFQ